ncbi:ATP-binding cassette domain-containing protein [Streptococcus suis]|nr:ATP-binding cassette domain-containing protein [Streptococcus suis]MCK4062219.1 ATP-binding cassette domain-containing protein [Streptococcus suis]NQK98164.1 ATP-binding cassette domain-containing protein [Streptococcus suis]
MFSIQSIQKKFGKRSLFSDVTLDLQAGKVYALIGASGSGKTTLLNILAKLESYDAGDILYKGKDLKKLKPHLFFREELGYLFQNFGLLESQTIRENLDLGLIGQKLSKDERKLRQEAALDAVGLSYLDLSQPIYELSGGEAQRVALAKVILKNPPLILADEPTAALDPKSSQEIMDILLSLKSPDRLIVIATHNP